MAYLHNVEQITYICKKKDLILAGIWFGKGKPNMNVFLNSFVESINILSTKGVTCLMKGSNVIIKIFDLLYCVDSVARAPVQGFCLFNGCFGCNPCLLPGK